MPSKGRYTAGKQVSRWEADSDNIDIEYKNLESQPQAGACVPYIPECLQGKRGLVLTILILVVVFAVGLVLGYLLRKGVNGLAVFTGSDVAQDKPKTVYTIQQDYNRDLSKEIQKELESVANYDDDLVTVISKQFRLSGVGNANTLISYIQKEWKSFPFDVVHVKRYNVTLSYPNYTNINNNSVTVQLANGSLAFQTTYNHSNIDPTLVPYNAYAASGVVTTKNLVYANYGRREDFEELKKLSVPVNGSLLVLKYGKIHPASKVRNAENHGALGVILYSDPADYANNCTNITGTWWLPNWAVLNAHVRYHLTGDPRTPDYSSITGIHNIPDKQARFPKIPVQPIRYNDAKYLLSDMAGPIVNNAWFGGLNLTYRTGPGYLDGRTVQLSVDNLLDNRDITNIVAVIKGHYEKDKYVIVGAHIDSWTKGVIDSGSGYTVLRELARSFSYHVGVGWRPRRTIMFALWDASKFGHIGAYEWVQEFEKQLSACAVAYINLDSLVRGNYSFFAEASSLLHHVIREAAGTVPCPEEGHSNITVYEEWVKRFPDHHNKSQSRIGSLGDDSDHAPFIYRLGIPVIAPMYTYNTNLYPNLPTYPVYGTIDDTVEYLKQFIDPRYQLHITTAKVVADIILRISDAAVLPYDVGNFVRVIEKGREILNGYQSVLEIAKIDIGILYTNIDTFCNAADSFQSYLKNLTTSKMSEFDLYLINDQLLQLSRAFITDYGLPGQPQYRNILVGPDPDNLNTEVIFPGLISALTSDTRELDDWTVLKQHISQLIMCLKRATDIMRNELTS